MAVLSNCKPADVFHYFEEICKIPHGSYNEKALSDYIHNWAADLGLASIQDEFLNLIIKKPATAGYENAPAVILQGHLDMVCEKNADVEFDFTKDPLDIYVDGDYIKARGTTLGADNGIAVAMAMAILADKNLAHPALEVVFTSVEEAGMDGAKGLDATYLAAKRLINLDSEDEGVFLSSCAGGATVTVSLDAEYEDLSAGDFVSYVLFVGGLWGGHSGMDIAKERGNSNRLLGRVLDGIKVAYHLTHIEGGSKDNAIPREAKAVIWVGAAEAADLAAQVAEIGDVLDKEYEHSDPGLFVKLTQTDVSNKKIFTQTVKENAIKLLIAVPHGVDHMSAALPGLVETSSNLGVVKIADGTIVYTCSVRSSVESRKWALTRRIAVAAEALGAACKISQGYPGWKYNPQSEIRNIFCDIYRQKYGKEAKILAIHAGLECGLFADKILGLDIIAMGPDMYDVHTPEEKLSISSTASCYEFLLDVLAGMNGG